MKKMIKGVTFSLLALLLLLEPSGATFKDTKTVSTTGSAGKSLKFISETYDDYIEDYGTGSYKAKYDVSGVTSNTVTIAVNRKTVSPMPSDLIKIDIPGATLKSDDNVNAIYTAPKSLLENLEVKITHTGKDAYFNETQLPISVEVRSGGTWKSDNRKVNLPITFEGVYKEDFKWRKVNGGAQIYAFNERGNKKLQEVEFVDKIGGLTVVEYKNLKSANVRDIETGVDMSKYNFTMDIPLERVIINTGGKFKKSQLEKYWSNSNIYLIADKNINGALPSERADFLRTPGNNNINGVGYSDSWKFRHREWDPRWTFNSTVKRDEIHVDYRWIEANYSNPQDAFKDGTIYAPQWYADGREFKPIKNIRGLRGWRDYVTVVAYGNLEMIGYSADLNQPVKEVIIEKDSIALDQMAFSSGSILNNNTIDLTKISSFGEYSLEGNKLTKVSLRADQEIMKGAFMGNEITEIYLPHKEIPYELLLRNKLEEVTSKQIPNATSIGGSAFAENRIRVVDLPKVTSLAAAGRQFYANWLLEASLPNATSIPEYAFGSNSNLGVYVTGKAKTIGPNAFNRTGLSQLIIEDSLESIDSKAIGGPLEVGYGTVYVDRKSTDVGSKIRGYTFVNGVVRIHPLKYSVFATDSTGRTITGIREVADARKKGYYSGNIEIPEFLTRERVIAINKGALNGLEITKLTVPDSIPSLVGVYKNDTYKLRINFLPTDKSSASGATFRGVTRAHNNYEVIDKPTMTFKETTSDLSGNIYMVYNAKNVSKVDPGVIFVKDGGMVSSTRSAYPGTGEARILIEPGNIPMYGFTHGYQEVGYAEFDTNYSAGTNYPKVRIWRDVKWEHSIHRPSGNVLINGYLDDPWTNWGSNITRSYGRRYGEVGNPNSVMFVRLRSHQVPSTNVAGKWRGISNTAPLVPGAKYELIIVAKHTGYGPNTLKYIIHQQGGTTVNNPQITGSFKLGPQPMVLRREFTADTNPAKHQFNIMVGVEDYVASEIEIDAVWLVKK